jgi:hypothetical protein
VDVLNRFILDIEVDRYGTSELEQAKRHIEAIEGIIGKEKALILFDRNYPSLDLLNVLDEKGIQYVIRLNSRAYKEEREGSRGGEGRIRILHTKARLGKIRHKDAKRAEELELKGSLEARIVKNDFAGEPGAFITNLGDEVRRAEVRNLYWKRWQIEQRFHALKNKMKGEYASGKNELYVKQDYWASVLAHNVIQDMIRGANVVAKKRVAKKHLKYAIRVNENIAIGQFKTAFIKIMLEDNDEQRNILYVKAVEKMAKNVVPIRKLPSKPRTFHIANKYKGNLKPSY